MPDRSHSISELAAELGITTRTIRFYEEKGLLAPSRNGQQRIYSAADRVRLKLILRGKRLGFTLEESRDLIDMYDPVPSSPAKIQNISGGGRSSGDEFIPPGPTNSNSTDRQIAAPSLGEEIGRSGIAGVEKDRTG